MILHMTKASFQKNEKYHEAPTRGPFMIISHGPMPAGWPKGRTPLSPGGPCLSPSKRLRASSASWSALRSLASVPSNEARRGINGFGSFCQNKRPVLSPVEGASPAGAKPGNTEKHIDTIMELEANLYSVSADIMYLSREVRS